MDTAFVLSPFADPYDEYYEVIFRPALRLLGLDARRGDSIFRSGNVVQQVFESIQESRLILADLSHGNANVFYELGIAHTLGRPCVLLSNDAAAIPFDLRSQRHVIYDVSRPDWARSLSSAIVAAGSETLAGNEPPVFSQAVAVVGSRTHAPDVSSQLLLLQASIDSMRSELGSRGPAAKEPVSHRLPAAQELSAMVAELLARDWSDDEIVEHLRSLGAPKLWATTAVETAKNATRQTPGVDRNG